MQFALEHTRAAGMRRPATELAQVVTTILFQLRKFLVLIKVSEAARIDAS